MSMQIIQICTETSVTGDLRVPNSVSGSDGDSGAQPGTEQKAVFTEEEEKEEAKNEEDKNENVGVDDEGTFQFYVIINLNSPC